jgi:hypothetical protein
MAIHSHPSPCSFFHSLLCFTSFSCLLTLFSLVRGCSQNKERQSKEHTWKCAGCGIVWGFGRRLSKRRPRPVYGMQRFRDRLSGCECNLKCSRTMWNRCAWHFMVSQWAARGKQLVSELWGQGPFHTVWELAVIFTYLPVAFDCDAAWNASPPAHSKCGPLLAVLAECQIVWPLELFSEKVWIFAWTCHLSLETKEGPVTHGGSLSSVNKRSLKSTAMWDLAVPQVIEGTVGVYKNTSTLLRQTRTR